MSQVPYQLALDGINQSLEAELGLGQLLILMQCGTSGIKRPERGNTRCANLKLSTEKCQYSPMNDVGIIQHAATLAQEADMQTLSQLHFLAAALLDRGDLGRAKAEELVDLKFA